VCAFTFFSLASQVPAGKHHGPKPKPDPHFIFKHTTAQNCASKANETVTVTIKFPEFSKAVVSPRSNPSYSGMLASFTQCCVTEDPTPEMMEKLIARSSLMGNQSKKKQKAFLALLETVDPLWVLEPLERKTLWELRNSLVFKSKLLPKVYHFLSRLLSHTLFSFFFL
jgi:hypothetical protein